MALATSRITDEMWRNLRTRQQYVIAFTYTAPELFSDTANEPLKVGVSVYRAIEYLRPEDRVYHMVPVGNFTVEAPTGESIKSLVDQINSGIENLTK